MNKTSPAHDFQAFYYSGSPEAAIFAEYIKTSVATGNIFNLCSTKATGFGVGPLEDINADPGDLDYIPETIRLLWKTHAMHPDLIAATLLEIGDIDVQQSRDFWTNEALKQQFLERLVQGIQQGIEATQR